jgi:hypothetical protein
VCDLVEVGVLEHGDRAWEQLGRRRLGRCGRVDGVALDEAGAVLAGVLDGGFGEGARDAPSAMRAESRSR